MSDMIEKENVTVAMMIAKRVARAAMVLVAAGAMTACIDEVTPLEREGIPAQTDAIRLYLDNQPVMTVYEDGRITLGPIVFLRTAANTATERPIRAELLDRAGNVIDADPAQVRINIGTSSTAVASYLRDGAFHGRIRSTTTTLPSTTDLLIGLYDLNQKRTAVGPYTVRITARLP